MLRNVEQKLDGVGKMVAWGPAADPAMPWQVKLAFCHVIEGVWSEISLLIMLKLKGAMKIESVSNYQVRSLRVEWRHFHPTANKVTNFIVNVEIVRALMHSRTITHARSRA